MVPDRAVVYEENGSAYISDSRLKVLTEEDYLSMARNKNRLITPSLKEQKIDHISSEITREIIIPELEREVNEGKYFAPLRQMYNSLILAIWFKKRYKEDLIGQVYVDKGKTSGIALEEKRIKEKIYSQYLRALKKGAYNFIREDHDEISNQIVPRKYFSGGFSFAMTTSTVTFEPASRLGNMRSQISALGAGLSRFTVRLIPRGISKRMLMALAAGALMLGSMQARADTAGDQLPLKNLQKVILKIDGNTGSLLGDHQGAVGYEHLKQVIDAIDHLPEGVPQEIRDEAQKLEQGLRDPQFFRDNLKIRNQGIPKGATLLIHPYVKPASKALVDDTIKELERDLGKFLVQPERVKVSASVKEIKVQPALKSTTGAVKHQIEIPESTKNLAPQPTQNVTTVTPLPQELPSTDKLLEQAGHPEGATNLNAVIHPDQHSPDIKPLASVNPVNKVSPNPVISSTNTASFVPVPAAIQETNTSSAGAPPAGPPPPKKISPLPAAVPTPAPPIAAQGITAGGGPLPQLMAGPYVISNTVVAIPVEDQVVAMSGGIVSGLDPEKKDYKAGDTMLILADPLLNSRIEQLAAELDIYKKKLSDLKILFDQQAASAQELSQARQQVDKVSQELALARQQKMATVVIAPHDLSVRNMLVVNGMQVNGGTKILRYVDKQRVRVNFTVPMTVNYFNRIEGLEINGEPVQSIVSVDWSPDPLQKDAQVSLVGDLSASVPLGKPISLKATIFPPRSTDQDLDFVTGKMATVAPVRGVEQYVIRSPADGPVKFQVREGQKVQEGQVVAVIENKHFNEEYESTRQAISAIDTQLSRSRDADGTLLIDRDQLDRLNAQKASQVSRLHYLQEQIDRLYVRSPGSGVVNSVANYESGASQNQELLRIGTGKVLIGDINDAQGAVLFPSDPSINTGDPVVVETPQGVRLPGQVTAVNGQLNSPIMDLSGFVSLEVMVNDQGGILSSNLPVKIILPKDDQAMTTSKIKVIVRNLALTLIAALSLMGKAQGQTNMDLNTVETLVDNNRLISGIQAIEVLQKKQEEKLPKATRFSLNGGVYMKDGKLYFSGGLEGMFNNMVGGSVQSGSAISAAVPVVYQLIGNVIDVVDGKVNKETKLAVIGTEITVHQMESDISHQVNEGQELLIDLGAVEQKIGQQKELLADLQHARLVMLERESAGFSLKVDRDKVEKDIQDVNAEILDLQGKKDNLTVALNHLIGQSSADLHRSLEASLPWGKEFTTIDEQTEGLMMATLTATNSPDPRMEGAIAMGRAVEMRISLQRLKRLPSLNMDSIYISGGASGSGSFYNLSSNEYLQRTSQLAPGGNTVGQINLPIFNSTVNTIAKVMSLDKAKAELNISKTQADLSRELGLAVGKIRNLSGRIQDAQAAYRAAYSVWELKAKRPDIYLPYQLIGDRLEAVKRWEAMVDLKAQYLKAEANLREMKVLGRERSDRNMQMINSFSTAVYTSVAGISQENLTPEASELPLEKPLPQVLPGQEHALAAGTVTYAYQNAGADASAAWALMHNSPIEGLKDIMISDPNPMVRFNAMGHFLSEYQNNAFLPALHETALRSPYPDVVWGLLKYMGTQEDHGIPFFVQMIQEAEDGNDRSLADAGYLFLGDTFEMYPDIAQKLQADDFTASSLYPRLSREGANKVFLTLMLKDPVARERLLNSPFFTLNARADIFNTLLAYTKGHQGQAGITNVLDLDGAFYASIEREMALRMTNDSFYPGGFGHLPETAPTKDIRIAVKIDAFKNANKQFLLSSPEWQSMQGFIHPNLYSRAHAAVIGLISADTGASSSPVPFYGLFASNPSFNDLYYFSKLGSTAQEEYIAHTTHLPELARILNLPHVQTSLQRNALGRLMQFPEGRILALRTYLGSSDNGLLNLIGTEPWQKLLKSDIPAVSNSADNRVLRSALLSFYEKTGDEGFLDLRLATYSIVELHSASDPRGRTFVDAKIKEEAVKFALNVMDARAGHTTRFWAGQAVLGPQEIAEMADVRAILEQETSPVKAVNAIESRSGQEGPSKGFYRKINPIADQFVKDIRDNNQQFPRFNTWETWSYGSVLAGLSLLTGGVIFNLWRRSKMGHQEMYSTAKSKILPRPLLKTRKKGGNGNGGNGTNGNGTNGNGPNGHHAMLTIDLEPPSDVIEATEKHFNAWRDVLSRWNEQYAQNHDIPVETLMEDLNQILNCAVEVLEDAPFKSKLMSSPEIQYQNTYIYFNLIIQKTLLILMEHVNVDTLSQTQKKRLGDSIDTLFDNVKYGKRFTRILAYRGNIDKVMSYTLPKYHWLEKSGLNPLSRWILGMQNTWVVSERKLFENLDILLDEGNSLSPGLYGNETDRQELVGETKAVLKDMTDNGSSIFDPTFRYDRRVNRLTGFAGRVVTIGGLVTSVLGLAAWLVNLSWVAVGGLSLGSFFWIGVTISMFWYPQYRNIKMEGLAMMDAAIDKLENKFKHMLPDEIGQTKNQDQDAEIVALNRQEGAEQVQKELDPAHSPSVDMLAIVPQNESYRAGLEKYVEKSRGKFIRKDVLAQIITSDHQGSGTVYLDVMEKARVAYEKRREQDPALRPWEQARVMFVFHGEDAYRDTSIQEELLNWGITNGYRAARKGYLDGSSKHQAGQILVYTRDAGAYFGDMPHSPQSGITIATSRVNSSALKESSFIHATSGGVITELLEDVDIDHLKERDTRMPRGGRLIKYLRENYDLDLPGLDQYEASNGIFLIAPDAVSVLEKTREYITQNNLWGRIYRLTSDLFIPMIMGNTWGKDEARKETREYVQERIGWGKKVDKRKLSRGPIDLSAEAGTLEKLYDFIQGTCNRSIAFHDFLPYPQSEVYIPIRSATVGEKAVKYKKLLHLSNVNSAMTTVPTGGVDLSGTRNIIKFGQDGMVPFAGTDVPSRLAALSSLKAFQGFGFKVIEYQPVSNPVELFLGASVGKGGSWFSSKASLINDTQA